MWHAGCATGEEAYSMAILLQEEGLYDRTTILVVPFLRKTIKFLIFQNDCYLKDF